MKFYNWQIILFFIFSSSLNNINYSQSINGNNFRIEHVRSFSKMGDFLEEGFFNKISKIIFGNNDLILNTPVSIFATDNDNLFILDQGLLNIVTVDLASEKFEIINSNLSFPSLISICMYKNGNYLFTDSKLNQIYILENEEHIRLLNDSLKLLKPTGIGYIASKNEIWMRKEN